MKQINNAATAYAQQCYPYNEGMRMQCETHFEAGAEWAMSEDRCKWHDLTKNPEDLPKRYKTVIVKYDNGEYGSDAIIKLGNCKEAFERIVLSSVTISVVAWMEIPPFEEGGAI